MEAKTRGRVYIATNSKLHVFSKFLVIENRLTKYFVIYIPVNFFAGDDEFLDAWYQSLEYSNTVDQF